MDIQQLKRALADCPVDLPRLSNKDSAQDDCSSRVVRPTSVFDFDFPTSWMREWSPLAKCPNRIHTMAKNFEYIEYCDYFE